MPVFLAKKEVFHWLVDGKKSIDIRKGRPQSGEFVTFMSGRGKITFRVVRTEFGRLDDVVHENNFRQVIPSARVLGDAHAYLCGIYGSCEGFFTAYYIASLNYSENG